MPGSITINASPSRTNPTVDRTWSSSSLRNPSTRMCASATPEPPLLELDHRLRQEVGDVRPYAPCEVPFEPDLERRRVSELPGPRRRLVLHLERRAHERDVHPG